MDRYAKILTSLVGLKERLDQAGVQRWLEQRPRVEIEGKSYFIIAGDRVASEAEAMLTFAFEHHLVSLAEVQSVSAREPLPPGVEAIDIDTSDGDK